MSAAITPRDRLQSLAGCGDPDSLRSALSELCSEFGKITRIEIFTLADAEKRRAFCLLRLESAAQERELRMALDAGLFGDDLLLTFDLPGSEAAGVAREARC